jgi:parvulin-like peptidyl-prolyl isomerase
MSRSRVWLLLALAALVSSCSSAAAGSSSTPQSGTSTPPASDPVVLTVNGRPVHRSELDLIRKDLLFSGAKPTAQQVRDRAVDAELVRERAQKLGITVSDDAVDKAYQAAGGDAAKDALAKFGIPLSHLRDRIAQNLLTKKLIATAYAGRHATEAQLHRRYEQRKSRFKLPLLVRVSAIQLRNRAAAMTALRLLRNGDDFDALARQLSMDPVTRNNGPDQGWKDPSKFPGQLGRLMRTTPSGKVAQTPIRVKASYVVIKVTDRREARQLPYQKVRGPIKRAYDAELRQAGFNRWLRSARRSATIDQMTASDSQP